MNEDIKKILKMIEDGKISAEEATVLIDAINEKDATITRTSKAKSLKIYVYDKVQDKKKVDVTIPLSLAKGFLKFGLKFVPDHSLKIDGKELQNMDFDEIIRAIEEGAQGTLVDIDESDQRVIIKVE